MTIDQELHRRRSIRLKGYDYSTPGAYFVTIASYAKKPLFGACIDDFVRLSQIGIIANDQLEKIPARFPYTHLDEFVIMPNHIHFIIQFLEGGTFSTSVSQPGCNQFGKPTARSLSSVVRAYKNSVTNQVRKVRLSGREPIFQKNYYERIIRDDVEWNNIREYIITNPGNWISDPEKTLDTGKI